MNKRQNYFHAGIVCLLLLSFGQLFLNLNVGWKAERIEALQTSMMKVNDSIPELSHQEAQERVQALNVELSALRKMDKIYQTFTIVLGILTLPCAAVVFFCRPRPGQAGGAPGEA